MAAAPAATAKKRRPERARGCPARYPLKAPTPKSVSAEGSGGYARELTAEEMAREVLALPMFPELTEAEQQWVVESVAEFYS